MADIKKVSPIKESEKPATPATPVVTAAAPVVATPAVAKPAAPSTAAPEKRRPGRPPASAGSNANKNKAKKVDSAPKRKPGRPAGTQNAAKNIAKEAPAAVATVKRGRKPVDMDKTDTVKKALWNALNKTKAKKIKEYIAVQVYAEGLDSFFIAVHNGEPMIERSYYQGHSGDLQATEKELLAIAKGKYDFIKAVKTNENVNFNGRLSVLLKIMDLFV